VTVSQILKFEDGAALFVVASTHFDKGLASPAWNLCARITAKKRVEAVSKMTNSDTETNRTTEALPTGWDEEGVGVRGNVSVDERSERANEVATSCLSQTRKMNRADEAKEAQLPCHGDPSSWK
jgi:hypothetical protein